MKINCVDQLRKSSGFRVALSTELWRRDCRGRASVKHNRSPARFAHPLHRPHPNDRSINQSSEERHRKRTPRDAEKCPDQNPLRPSAISAVCFARCRQVPLPARPKRPWIFPPNLSQSTAIPLPTTAPPHALSISTRRRFRGDHPITKSPSPGPKGSEKTPRKFTSSESSTPHRRRSPVGQAVPDTHNQPFSMSGTA